MVGSSARYRSRKGRLGSLDSLDANRIRLAGDFTNDFLPMDSIDDKQL